jgi:hypothetical protein
MRKMFFPFALLLLSGMAFTSCSQDEEIVSIRTNAPFTP